MVKIGSIVGLLQSAPTHRTSMTRHVGSLVSIVLVASSLTIAQSECPEGFRYVGTLSGSGSSFTAFDNRVQTRLPKGARLDTSYQQTEVRATNRRSGMDSQLRPEEIPKGILIIPSGTSDDIYKQGWAVSAPKLEALDRDAKGNITRYVFGMKLSCKVGHSGANPHFGDCVVYVEVCFKPLN